MRLEEVTALDAVLFRKRLAQIQQIAHFVEEALFGSEFFGEETQIPRPRSDVGDRCLAGDNRRFQCTMEGAVADRVAEQEALEFDHGGSVQGSFFQILLCWLSMTLMLRSVRRFLPEIILCAIALFFTFRELGTFPAAWEDSG